MMRAASRNSGLAAALLAAAIVSTLAGNAAAQTAGAYWYDGSVRRELYGVSARPETREKALAANPSADGTAFFTERPGSARVMGLPGGVVVTLRETMSPSRAQQFLASRGLTPVRPIGDGSTTWLVASDPGLPSLHLANRLYESGDFAAASPNWWQARAKK